MSKLIYKDQSTSELEYSLLLTPDLKSDFNILKNELIRWQGTELEFSIIGASHFVKINIRNDQQLIELLACIEGDLSADKTLQKNRLINHNNFKYCYRFSQNFIYRFKADILKEKINSHQEFLNKYLDNDENIYFIMF
jgi:hypothetical protein